MEQQRSRRRRLLGWLAVPFALLGSSVVVWQASSAALTPDTRTGTNEWVAGRVDLAADGRGSALFDAGRLVPGDGQSRCLTVTYSGTIAADVRLRLAEVGGRLGDYLAMTVEEGTGGTSSCDGFVPQRRLTDPGATLTSIAATHGSWATGLGGWQPAGPGATRTYRIAWTVRAGDDAQGLEATGRFVWEARSR